MDSRYLWEHAYLLVSVWGRATRQWDDLWECDDGLCESLSMARLRYSTQSGMKEWVRVHTKNSTDQSRPWNGAGDGQQPEGASPSAASAPLVTEVAPSGGPGIGAKGVPPEQGVPGAEAAELDATFREKREAREKNASEQRKKSLFPPNLSFYFIFPRRQMASVNTWKQTELVAISGLQIHFVPKKDESGQRRTSCSLLSLWIRYSEGLCSVLDLIVSS